jgi:hypothetical protein
MLTGDTTMTRNKHAMGFITLLWIVGTVACGDVKKTIDDAKNTNKDTVDKVKDAAGQAAEQVAKACGLGCPGDDVGGVKVRGLAQGNASISGVAQVDAFFASVLDYKNSAEDVSAGIEAQLDAIRGDFGFDADADVADSLQAQISEYVEGSLRVEEQPGHCQVSAKAAAEAAARCDAEVDPGKAMVACKGRCQVDASASASCDANADLYCTATGPTLNCQGMCQGTCQVDLSAAASCAGTCHGTCSGTCSAYADAAGTQCAGTCSGMCQGSCETELMAGASCAGMCNGSCSVQGPQGGCQGGARVECQAKANASVMCQGSCDGDFDPPTAKAECQASAKCSASLDVQCTPPRLAVVYTLKSGATVDAAAIARFNAAVETLHRVRLPALLQAAAKADVVARAGEGLVTAADGAVKGAVNAAIKGDLSVRAAFGLGCAVKELPKVQDTLSDSNDRLNGNLARCDKVRNALNMGS